MEGTTERIVQDYVSLYGQQAEVMLHRVITRIETDEVETPRGYTLDQYKSALRRIRAK